MGDYLNVPTFDSSKSINSILKILTGALINRNSSQKGISYSLFDPSIGDFVIANYLDNFDYITQILDSLGTFESINYIGQLKFAGYLSEKNCNIIYQSLFERRVRSYDLHLAVPFNVKLMDKIICLRHCSLDEENNITSILNGFIKDEKILTVEQFDLYYTAIEFDFISKNSKDLKCRILDFLEAENFHYSFEDLVAIKSLLETIIGDEDFDLGINQLYKNRIIDTLEKTLNDLIIEEGSFDDFFYHVASTPYDFDVEYNEAAVIQFVEEKLSEFHVQFENDEIERISSTCDFDRLYNYHMESDNDFRRFGKSEERDDRFINSIENQIDDLFDKS